MTIVEAIKEVFGREGQPLTSKKIYEKIVAGGLYEFSAKEPEQVVRGTIRKHCVGLDLQLIKSIQIIFRKAKQININLDVVLSILENYFSNVETTMQAIAC